MCQEAAEEPSVMKGRAGLFWLRKTETVQDEKVDGEYALIINGHSLVRLFPVHDYFQWLLNQQEVLYPFVAICPRSKSPAGCLVFLNKVA